MFDVADSELDCKSDSDEGVLVPLEDSIEPDEKEDPADTVPVPLIPDVNRVILPDRIEVKDDAITGCQTAGNPEEDSDHGVAEAVAEEIKPVPPGVMPIPAGDWLEVSDAPSIPGALVDVAAGL